MASAGKGKSQSRGSRLGNEKRHRSTFLCPWFFHRTFTPEETPYPSSLYGCINYFFPGVSLQTGRGREKRGPLSIRAWFSSEERDATNPIASPRSASLNDALIDSALQKPRELISSLLVTFADLNLNIDRVVDKRTSWIFLRLVHCNSVQRRIQIFWRKNKFSRI